MRRADHWFRGALPGVCVCVCVYLFVCLFVIQKPKQRGVLGRNWVVATQKKKDKK
jgi:hypothetical protein